MASERKVLDDYGIDIFEFVDYRAFLIRWRKAVKEADRRYSNEFICRKLGVSNRAYYVDLEKGRRNIGTEMQERIILLMRLSAEESKYFRALVGFGSPSSVAEKSYWFEQLIALNHTPRRIVSPEEYEFYRTWYHTTVRALLDTYEYRGDAKDASRRLLGRVSAKEIEESIQLLCKLGLVEKKGECYTVTGKVLTTGETARNELLRQFQLSNIQLMERIIQENHPGSHTSSVLTLSLSESARLLIEEQMRSFRSKVIAIVHKDTEPATQVIKIATHLITESSR